MLFVQLFSVNRERWGSAGSTSDRTGVMKDLFCLQISLPLALALSNATRAVDFNIIKRVMS